MSHNASILLFSEYCFMYFHWLNYKLSSVILTTRADKSMEQKYNFYGTASGSTGMEEAEEWNHKRVQASERDIGPSR